MIQAYTFLVSGTVHTYAYRPILYTSLYRGRGGWGRVPRALQQEREKYEGQVRSGHRFDTCAPPFPLPTGSQIADPRNVIYLTEFPSIFDLYPIFGFVARLTQQNEPANKRQIFCLEIQKPSDGRCEQNGWKTKRYVNEAKVVLVQTPVWGIQVKYLPPPTQQRGHLMRNSSS